MFIIVDCCGVFLEQMFFAQDGRWPSVGYLNGTPNDAHSHSYWRKFDSIRLSSEMQLESASTSVGVDNINHMIVLEPGWLSPGLKYIIVKQLQELACKRICY